MFSEAGVRSDGFWCGWAYGGSNLAFFVGTIFCRAQNAKTTCSATCRRASFFGTAAVFFPLARVRNAVGSISRTVSGTIGCSAIIFSFRTIIGNWRRLSGEGKNEGTIIEEKHSYRGRVLSALTISSIVDD